MKKTLLLIVALTVAMAGCNKLENNEKKYLKGMQSDDYEKSSQAFADFCHWLEQDRETMTYDFPLMREQMGLKAVTSPDGKLRCYSWDTSPSDSIHSYANVSQWYAGESFVAFSGPLGVLLEVKDPDLDRPKPLPHMIDTIYELKMGELDIYLIAQSYINKYGNRRAYVSACHLNGVRLTPLPFFFDGTERAGNSEFHDNPKALTPVNELFKWDEKNGKLYAYEIDDQGNRIPGKYTEYQLDPSTARFSRVTTETQDQ